MKGLVSTQSLPTPAGSKTSTAQRQINSSPNQISSILQLQKQIGNRAVTQLLRTRAQSGPTIQRAIDKSQVERCKNLLELPENVQIRILQIPKNTHANRKLSTIDAGYKMNIPDLEQFELFEILFNKTKAIHQEETEEDSEYYSDAELLADQKGGAAYMANRNLILISTGSSERDLLHEMGHLKQNKVMGFRSDPRVGNSSQILLELHNVLLHENLIEDKIGLRVTYNKDLSNWRTLPPMVKEANDIVSGTHKTINLGQLEQQWTNFGAKIAEKSTGNSLRERDPDLFKDIDSSLTTMSKYEDPWIQVLIKRYIMKECENLVN